MSSWRPSVRKWVVTRTRRHALATWLRLWSGSATEPWWKVTLTRAVEVRSEVFKRCGICRSTMVWDVEYISIYILLVFGCFEESIDIVSDGDGLVHQKIGCCLHVMHGWFLGWHVEYPKEKVGKGWKNRWYQKTHLFTEAFHRISWLCVFGDTVLLMIPTYTSSITIQFFPFVSVLSIQRKPNIGVVIEMSACHLPSTLYLLVYFLHFRTPAIFKTI